MVARVPGVVARAVAMVTWVVARQLLRYLGWLLRCC